MTQALPSLHSLQTTLKNQATTNLQPAMAIHPPGYFQNLVTRDKASEDPVLKHLATRLNFTDERIRMTRYRLLPVDWESIVPASIYGRDTEFRFLRAMFEQSWGGNPFTNLSISAFIDDRQYTHFQPVSLPPVIAYAWPKQPDSGLTSLVLTNDGESYALFFGGPVDFAKDYEGAWSKVAAAVKVKPSIRGDITLPIAIQFQKVRTDTLAPAFLEAPIPVLPDVPGFPFTPPAPDLGGPVVDFDPERPILDLPNPTLPPIELKDPVFFLDFVKHILNTEDSIKPSKVRSIVERDWMVSAEPIDTSELIFSYDPAKHGVIFVGDPEPIDTAKENPAFRHNLLAFRFYSAQSPEEQYTRAKLPENTLLIRDGLSGRVYAAIQESESDNQSTPTDLSKGTTIPRPSSQEEWEAVWQQATVFAMVSLDPGDNQSDDYSPEGQTHSLGRLETRTILERYQALKAEQETLVPVSEIQSKWLDTLGNEQEFEALTLVKTHSVIQQITRTKQRLHAIQQQLVELQGDAQQLGYRLFLEAPQSDGGGMYKPYKDVANAPPRIRDIAVPVPQPGNLYLERTVKTEWKTYHKRTEFRYKTVRSGFLGLSRSTKRIPVTVHYTRKRKSSYTRFDAVGIGDEPWEILRNDLLRENYSVHMLEEADGGYFNQHSESLVAIMQRCRVDERYRLRTALFIPEYDPSFRDGGRVLVRYQVIIKPMPGFTPVALPDVHVLEGISHRKVLAGTELGELVKSIALAPGESRSMTYTRSFSQKTDKRRSIRSFQDLVETDESSFEAALEDEMKSDANASSSNTSSSTVSAGGSYAGFSGSASFTNSSTDSSSLNTFLREVEGRSQQSSRRVSRSIKDEVTTELTETVSSETSESITTEIQNINQGASLNLMFHRLYNTYLAGVYLDDLALQLTHPFELVQGTGIRHKTTYKLNDFDHFVRDLQDFCAPFDFGNDDLSSTLQERVLQFVEAALRQDYLKFEAITVSENEGRKADSLRELVNRIQLRQQALATFFIRLPSTSSYVDSQLGANPATEPYSEALRAEELLERQAQRRLIGAKAASYGNAVTYIPVPNTTFAARHIDGQFIEVSTSKPLQDGHWMVYDGISPLGPFNPDNAMISWQGSASDLELAPLQLLEITQGLSVPRER